MSFVDTHCHIQSAGNSSGERTTREIWAKLPDVSAQKLVTNAQQANVSKMLCVGCDTADSRLAIDFVSEQPNCWASVGIHPHEAQHYAHRPARQAEFKDLLKAKKVIAVGECGLDYFYAHSPKADQLTVLRWQIELALSHDLPLIFHVREAYEDFWPIFDSYAGIRGVLHSFTDSLDNLEKAQDRGLFIGVNGIATFVKNESQLAVYRAISSKALLLETDAPFLTPTPYRGTINEPKYIRRIAEFMAQLRGEGLETLGELTTHNAQSLFGI